MQLQNKSQSNLDVNNPCRAKFKNKFKKPPEKAMFHLLLKLNLKINLVIWKSFGGNS